MPTTYTKYHFDFTTLPWLTNPRKQLDLQGVALGFINLPANEGYTFTHKHRSQEEVYIVTQGSGFLQIDGRLIEITQGDAIRVAPQARRALKAKEQGIFIICAGGIPMGYPKNPNARYLIDDGEPDYDDIPSWYQGNTKIEEKNRKLKERMEKAKR